MLGMWVHRLRRDYKKALLPQWQVDRLDTLDFAWKVDVHSAKWHHALHEARRYKGRPFWMSSMRLTCIRS